MKHEPITCTYCGAHIGINYGESQTEGVCSSCQDN